MGTTVSGAFAKDVESPSCSGEGRRSNGIYCTGTVWLIEVATGKIIDRQQVSDLGCGSVAFSPDGRYLVAPSNGGLIKWPYDRGGTIRVFRIAQGALSRCCIPEVTPALCSAR